MPWKERQTHSLDVHPSYKGGHTLVSGGYIFEFCPGHPQCNAWGWIAQHRLVGEDIVGRPLVRHASPKVRECVHHKDENRLNNAPDNLEVMTFSAHRSYHTRKRNVDEFQSRLPTRAAVEKALATTATIKLAAAEVGCCHHTLRNHFADLVKPYQRRKPTNPFEPSEAQLKVLRTLASDPTIGEREASRAVGVSSKTMRKICANFGIPWVRKSRVGGKQKRKTTLQG